MKDILFWTLIFPQNKWLKAVWYLCCEGRVWCRAHITCSSWIAPTLLAEVLCHMFSCCCGVSLKSMSLYIIL
ncbi:hypothetical protein KUCAC02_034291 [Chaenocephalus aceratus]|nr:hypothetical protein KUCAC02_034291 [Chaenocephalus aceratus]